VNVAEVVAADVDTELADGLEERQALDVAHGAATSVMTTSARLSLPTRLMRSLISVVMWG